TVRHPGRRVVGLRELVDDWLPVEGVHERLADPRVVQGRGLAVAPHHLEEELVSRGALHVWVTGELAEYRRLEGEDVHSSDLAIEESADAGARANGAHGDERDVIQKRNLAVVPLVPDEDRLG